jgi:2'-5' RNA ligase
MRLFFAVPVPDGARAAVGELMDRVQGQVGDGRARIRWVRVQGLHLTLRFLGPTPNGSLPPLVAGQDAVARVATPFEVVLNGGGAFPSVARPRTLWIGVVQGDAELGALSRDLTAAAEGCGLHVETRPFAPHLTVGRTDGLRQGPVAAQALEAAARDLDVRFAVERIGLYRSILGHGPARYEPVHEVRLGA